MPSRPPARTQAYEYGKQVVRLRKAVAACKGALTSAESNGVARNETGALADAAARLQAAEAHAAHENTTIYQEELPGHMGSVEGKVVVKPTPPELLREPHAAFGLLLPESVRQAVEAHHNDVYRLLHGLASQVSADAQAVQEELRRKDLPQKLEAVTMQDKALPEHTRSKLAKAKATCSTSQLFDLRAECENCEGEANSLIELLDGLLKQETEKDAALTEEVPNVNLSSLRSSMALATCRSTVTAAAEKVKTAVSVTSSLGARLDAAISDLHAISPSISEIEAQMPHLDGTPLEQEPCVGALRSLLDSLEQVRHAAAQTLN